MAVLASTSLTGATATGPGATVDFLAAVSNASMVLTSDGTVTGGFVTVEASHNGTVWAKLDGYRPQSGLNQTFCQKGGSFRYWRANILKEITGGGSVTATFMEAG